MKKFYRLKGWQWLAAAVTSVLWLHLYNDHTRGSLPEMLFTILLSVLMAYSMMQGLARHRLDTSSLSLIIKTAGSDLENKLADKLHQLFKSAFPKESTLKFNGFDCNEEQVWFYFKGADPDVIMKAIQPLLKDIPLPEGSHLLVKTGPNQTKELPVFATVQPL
jgi:hypothetical protein